MIKKKKNKINLDNLLNDINLSFEKVCNKIGSNNCKNTLDIYLTKNFDDKYLGVDSFLESQNDEYNNIFNLYNEYFIPLSSNKILESDIDKFIYHEFYMDKMDLLNNIHIKINNYEELIDKKKNK